MSKRVARLLALVVAAAWLLTAGLLTFAPSPASARTTLAPAAVQGPYPPVPPTVTVDRTRFALGGCITISGTSFKPGTSVTITEPGGTGTGAPVGEDGSFSHESCYTTQADCGRHTVTIVGTQPDGTVVREQRTFVVTCLGGGTVTPITGPTVYHGGKLPFTGSVALISLALFGVLAAVVGTLLVRLGRRRAAERLQA